MSEVQGLRALQQRFQAYLIHPGEPLCDAVVGSERLSVEERLDVYVDAYRTRLSEALAHDFPALQVLLGDKGFRAMVRAYVDAHPSRHFSIRWFGSRLSAFLAEHPDYAKKPVLAEMAAFEWALSGALDAADGPRLTAADLAVVAPERWPELRFTVHPSVNRLDLVWDVPPLWKAIDDGEPPRAPQRAGTPQPWVIWRKDLASYFYSMDADEAWALDTLRSGGCFADLCEGLCRWRDEDQVAGRAAVLLRVWVDYGMLSTIR